MSIFSSLHVLGDGMYFLSRSHVLGLRLRKVAAKESAFLCKGASRQGN